ncbi:MAG: nickel/cobalt transporter (NiCoT) family protein [Frankiaceae bacterium]|nr:nickel/cobalt transporter (NiCoT) family protein [Frankiaceae bacterium]MDQ1648515.1 nickel/cobalt transporter (NiCoT) family protein [Frankiaceae bacterium]
MTPLSPTLTGRWTRSERLRLGGIVSFVALLHIVGWSLYLWSTNHVAEASTFAGAGTLAYVLGIRHAFDADHIAAIDDTTRLMIQRGRRPIGVGFFFSLGHSSVVLVLAFVVALAAGAADSAGVTAFRAVGGVVAAVVAASFLLLVAVLNAVVLRGVARLWRRVRSGVVSEEEVDLALLNRGLLNRMLGGRARTLIRSSWHMFPVGVLFGLGLETASEVTLLSLSASTATAGGLPVLAVLSLPLLFAAGMSALDTLDSVLMSRAYTWAFRSPARRLYYNLATTGMTVFVAAFIGSVYLAALVVDATGWGGPVAAYAGIADHFEVLGYAVAGTFLVSWSGAALYWKFGKLEERYG